MCALWSHDDEEDRRRQRLLREALEDIRDQRSKLRLELPPGVTSLTGLTGSLLDFDGDGLAVELASLKKAPRAFTGVPLTCYFRVRDRENRNLEQYMAFETTVRATEQRPGGMVLLRLDYPTGLRNA